MLGSSLFDEIDLPLENEKYYIGCFVEGLLHQEHSVNDVAFNNKPKLHYIGATDKGLEMAIASGHESLSPLAIDKSQKRHIGIPDKELSINLSSTTHSNSDSQNITNTHKDKEWVSEYFFWYLLIW